MESGGKKRRTVPQGLRLVRAVVRCFVKRNDEQLDDTAFAAVKAYVRGSAQAAVEVREAVWAQLSAESIRARLCGLRVAEELFQRSVAFRQSACPVLQPVAELCCLPEDGLPAVEQVRVRAIMAMHSWYEQFVAPLARAGKLPTLTSDYRKQLSLTYEYLRDKRNIDFRLGLAPPNLAQGRREAAVAALNENANSMSIALDAVDNALDILWTNFEGRFEVDENNGLEATNTSASGCAAANSNAAPSLVDDDNIDMSGLLVIDDDLFGDNGEENLEESLPVHQQEMSSALPWNNEEQARMLSNADNNGVALRGHGIHGHDYEVPVVIRTENVVAATSDNEPVVRQVRDGVREISQRFLPMLREWKAMLEGDDNVAADRQRVDQLIERAQATIKRAKVLVTAAATATTAIATSSVTPSSRSKPKPQKPIIKK